MFDMNGTIQDLRVLNSAWNIIENEYNDSEEKDIAQKVINDLIVEFAIDVAQNYKLETDNKS